MKKLLIVLSFALFCSAIAIVADDKCNCGKPPKVTTKADDKCNCGKPTPKTPSVKK